MQKLTVHAMIASIVASSLATLLEPEELPNGVEILYIQPVDGYVDPRTDRDDQGRPLGLDMIVIWFSRSVDAPELPIQIASTDGAPPSVAAIEVDGPRWLVWVDRSLRGGEAWRIVFAGGATSVPISSLPGDVDGNLIVEPEDRAVLTEAVRVGSDELERFDIDRNGRVDEQDVVWLDVLLSGSDGGKAWLGESLATDDPSLRCCCLLGICTPIIASACPTLSVEVPCPCQNDSCNGVGS